MKIKDNTRESALRECFEDIIIFMVLTLKTIEYPKVLVTSIQSLVDCKLNTVVNRSMNKIQGLNLGLG